MQILEVLSFDIHANWWGVGGCHYPKRPSRTRASVCSRSATCLVGHCVKMRLQLHRVLLCGRTPNGNRRSGIEIAALNLCYAPGQSAPYLLVVITLDRQQLATLLGDNFEDTSDRLSTRRAARPAPHDLSVLVALLKKDAQVSPRWRFYGRFNRIRALVRK